LKMSIVLLCHNNWELTRDAIQSLVPSFTPALRSRGIELLIVDNGSTDVTTAQGPAISTELSDPSISISYVRLEENLGIPMGMNVGLGRSTGDLIAFVNNDLIFPYGWLDSLAGALLEDPALGFAVPYLTYTSILEQYAEPDYPTMAEMPAYAQKFMAETRGRKTLVGRIITSCVACRRDLLDKIGGADFWFGAGSSDDSDWSARSQIAGYRNAVIGGSFVHHIGSATFHQIPSSGHVYQINGGKFLRKSAAMTNVPYSRKLHYIPVRTADFNPLSPTDPQWTARGQDGKRVLLIADWVNETSGWRDTLIHILSQNEGEQLYLHIPSMYFDVDHVSGIVHSTVSENGLGSKETRIHLLDEDVPHVDFLNFILRFDSIAAVPGDLVNRAVRFLRQGCVQG